MVLRNFRGKKDCGVSTQLGFEELWHSGFTTMLYLFLVVRYVELDGNSAFDSPEHNEIRKRWYLNVKNNLHMH